MVRPDSRGIVTVKCVWTPSSVRSATDPSGFTSPEKEFVVEKDGAKLFYKKVKKEKRI